MAVDKMLKEGYSPRSKKRRNKLKIATKSYGKYMGRNLIAGKVENFDDSSSDSVSP